MATRNVLRQRAADACRPELSALAILLPSSAPSEWKWHVPMMVLPGGEWKGWLALLEDVRLALYLCHMRKTGSQAGLLYIRSCYLSIDLIKYMFYNIPMDMFVALSDPTRRAILEILASRGELSATDIYEHFSVSPQAISQHLKVLREASLVVMEKRAQKHLYRLNPHTLSLFEEWVQQTRQRWEERFEALDRVLEREKLTHVKDDQEGREE